MAYDLSDYVDVAERVQKFHEKYPEGTLQSEWKPVVLGGQEVIVVKAFAYRTPDDQRPGIGHAMEPLPGLTKFTRNSELMVGETSAWGRALAALGFEVKRGIASREEVQNRTDVDGGGDTAAPVATAVSTGADGGGGDSLSQSPNPAAVGFASEKQRKFYDRLLKASVPASAQSTVTRYLEQTSRFVVSAAIDSLKEKDTPAIDQLLLEATNWESTQSNVPYDANA